MKVEDVEKLLVAFYEAKTTEEQEEDLRKYFSKDDIPEKLFVDKKLFLSLCEKSKVEVPIGLGARLAQLIDEKAEEEKKFFIKNKLRRNWNWVGKIAASLLILICIGYGIHNYRMDSETPKDTFSDPVEAYKAVQAALVEVSANMNTGLDQLAETRKEVKKINNEIINEIK